MSLEQCSFYCLVFISLSLHSFTGCNKFTWYHIIVFPDSQWGKHTILIGQLIRKNRYVYRVVKIHNFACLLYLGCCPQSMMALHTCLSLIAVLMFQMSNPVFFENICKRQGRSFRFAFAMLGHLVHQFRYLFLNFK